jgi:hypothetical protein
MKLLKTIFLSAALGSSFLFPGAAFSKTWSAVRLGPVVDCHPKLYYNPPIADENFMFIGINNLGWVVQGPYIYGMNGPGTVATLSSYGGNVCASGINDLGQVTGFFFLKIQITQIAYAPLSLAPMALV